MVAFGVAFRLEGREQVGDGGLGAEVRVSPGRRNAEAVRAKANALRPRPEGALAMARFRNSKDRNSEKFFQELSRRDSYKGWKGDIP